MPEGKDSLGRRFRVVNGKRVNASDDDFTSKPKRLVNIEDLINDYTKNAHGATDIKAAIARLIDKRLRTTFNIVSRTNAGLHGQLFAARLILAKLHEADPANVDPAPPHPDTFSGPDFLEKLKAYGVPLMAPPSPNDDYEILKIVHQAGINADTLRQLLHK